MTKDAKPSRPIGTVRIGTPLLVGIVLAISAPIAVASVVESGVADPGNEEPSSVSLAGSLTQPITKVVVHGANGSVRVTGDKSVSGVKGTAVVDWHGNAKPTLDETVADGVATLTFSPPAGVESYRGGVGWDVSVPLTADVVVATSDGTATLDGLGGTVDATTTNASIEARGLGSGVATLTSSNGDIRASFVGAPSLIKAETSNASVTIETDGKTPYFDKLHTTNGNTTPDNPGADDYTLAPVRMIDVKTTNGNINVR
jgi:DUF4097 and DUF4098 domain-containing protein YvlB